MCAVAGAATVLHALHGLGPLERSFADPVTRGVFLVGAVALGLIALGVANSGLLFVVGRAPLAARAVSIAAILDIIFGLCPEPHTRLCVCRRRAAERSRRVCAHLRGYWARKVLRRANHSLYAAF